MTSILSAFPFLAEQSFATPGAWNSPLSILSANIAAVNADVGAISGVTISPPTGNTITIASNLSITGQLQSGPIHTDGPVRIDVNSNLTNYLYLSDASNLRSDYIIGSQVGGTADGLNIWDDSGQTMIVSFSKQSVRFYQQVVGPVFDVGGALADTLNAATFGTGADSKETRIQAAINAAAAAGISRVYVSASLYPYSASSISFNSAVKMVAEGQNWGNYNVIAYGAAGGGVADDFYSLQACLTAAFQANGGVMEVPPFVYSCSSTLHTPASVAGAVKIAGNGRPRSFTGGVDDDPILRQGATVVYTGTAGDVFFSQTTKVSTRVYLTIENISFEGKSGNTLGHGLHLQATNILGGILASLKEVTVNNMPESGIFWDGNVFESRLFDVRSSQNSGRGFYAAANGATLPGETRMYGCTFDHNALPGVDISGGGHWSLHGLTSTANTGTGLLINNVLFDAYDVQLESNGSVFARFIDCTGAIITGININYGSNSSATGLLFTGTSGCNNNTVIGMGTNGAATNTDIVFSDGTQSQNEVSAYKGNLAGLLSIVDNGFYNTVRRGSFVSGSLQMGNGSASAPVLTFKDDPGVGWYRSAASIMAQSAGSTLLRGLGIGVSPSNNATLNVHGASDIAASIVIRVDGGDASHGAFLQFSDNVGWNTGFGGDVTTGDFAWYDSRSYTAAGTLRAKLTRTNGQFLLTDGTALIPTHGFSSETSLGLYRSGASTVALSYGTVNLATNAVRLSMRTIAASALTASAANTNVAVNEAVFTIQASGASFVINSGGTTWIFNSSASAKNT